MTDSRLFLDSSVWIGYFLGDLPESKKAIDSPESILFTSIISVHEVLKKLEERGMDEKEAEQAIKFMEENSIIVNLNRETARNSVDCCFKYGLHTIDSLIYASSMGLDAVFVTGDKDFNKTPKTRILS